MKEVTQSRHGSDRSAFIIAAVWLGLVTGLVEAVGWLTMQRFDRLTSVWTQVLWIAPLVNGLAFLALGLVLTALAMLVRHTRRSRVVAFGLAGAAAVNFVALTLAPFVHRFVLPIVVLGIAVSLVRAFRRDEDRSRRFFRRTLPIVAAIVLALFVGVQSFYALRERSRVRALPAAAEGAPDVVVVVLDALRADHVSAYGYPRATSPFIDQLAEEGVLFERAISASPYSLPSHASLLSGLLPHEHGVEWLEFNVFRDAAYPSIAEVLRDRGYRTGAFSANPFWFTREQGFGRGFVRFEDFYHSMADAAYRTVFGKIFEVVLLRLGFEEIPARKRATESTDRVLDWALRDDDRPFFAFINYFDVHDPYTPPEPYRSRFPPPRILRGGSSTGERNGANSTSMRNSGRGRSRPTMGPWRMWTTSSVGCGSASVPPARAGGR